MTETARTIPLAKLDLVNENGDVMRISYQGECVTLSPAMTLEEFRSEIVRLEALKERVATERAKREAARK